MKFGSYQSEIWFKVASSPKCLKATLNKYHNRVIATQEIIDELIKLAKEMSAANQRGVDLGLNDDEVAFYDRPRRQ